MSTIKLNNILRSTSFIKNILIYQLSLILIIPQQLIVAHINNNSKYLCVSKYYKCNNIEIQNSNSQLKISPKNTTYTFKSKKIQEEDILNSKRDTKITLDKENEIGGGGIVSPEFSRFESVNSDNLVDPFTGDFTYNLPLLEVPGAHDGGYAVSLSYHSGNSPEEDASWVGYGWTLNPGAINRIKRGFPDDLNGGTVEQINDVPKNWTMSIDPQLRAEIFSFPAFLKMGFKYNNYKGFGSSLGTGLGSKFGSITYNYEDGTGSFSLEPNINYLLSKANNTLFSQKQSESENNRSLMSTLNYSGFINYAKSRFSTFQKPYNPISYKGSSYTFGLGLEGDPFEIIVGLGSTLSATYSQQIPQAITTRLARGFLYTQNAQQNNTPYEWDQTNKADEIMDYYSEKGGVINIRDKFLPMPNNNSDLFQVTSEGINGTFKAFSKKPMLFMQPTTKSTTDMIELDAQVHLGTDLGIGITVSAGLTDIIPENGIPTIEEALNNISLPKFNGSPSKILMGGMVAKSNPNWQDNGNSDDTKFKIDQIKIPGTSKQIEEDEPYVFRFLNDMGGNIIFNDYDEITNLNDEALCAKIEPTEYDIWSNLNIPSNKVVQAKIKLPDNFPKKIFSTVDNERVGRTQYIKVNTFDQMNNNIFRKFEKGNDLVGYFDASETQISSQIGEIGITNTEGDNYVYGLPVFVKDQEMMQYKVSADDIDNSKCTYGDHIIYANINNEKQHTGEKHKYAYPSSWLLTSIRSSDYQDRGNPGFDEEDIGGYTKFKYQKLFGDKLKYANTTNWINFRTPYTGLILNQNHLWDKYDDMASYSSGKKEQYLLETIETKTHIAIFVTNGYNGYIPAGSSVILKGSNDASLDIRNDAIDANADNFLAASKPDIQGSNKQKKLKKILLYAKPTIAGGAYKLLKTVRFEYMDATNEAWPGVLGSAIGRGKLTLKKVWIENQEIKNNKVSPYEFLYEYPTSSINYPTVYNNLKDHYQFNIGLINPQKPNFNDKNIGGLCLDKWGCYNYQAKENRQKLISSTTQNFDPKNFDPAAWQLKQIILPTKAEMHIQYEKDDYQYVQNKNASLMVSMKNNTVDMDNEYIIKKEELGLNNSADVNQYINFLNNYFTNSKEGEYVYFKFLYDLSISTGKHFIKLPLDRSNCEAEYIDGYVGFNKALLDANGDIKITLGPKNPIIGQTAANAANNYFLDIPFIGTGKYLYPRTVCFDFVKSETGWQAGKCSNDLNPNDIESLPQKLINIVSNYIGDICGPINGLNICGSINPELSYLKLPLMPNQNIKGKKGDGLRVKRVLMYDKGMEVNNSDVALYGTQYDYIDEEGFSSGVASNEPSEDNYENSLIDFLDKRKGQSLLNKIMSGVDKQQFEGPMYESLLPSPTVGYSRVVKTNIHLGKTGPGFNISNFYTYKDFPSIDGFSYTPLESGDNQIFTNQFLYLILFSLRKSKLWETQGYRFKQNNMNGKPKSQSMYAGIYNFDAPFKSGNLSAPIHSTEYEYYAVGDKIPITSGDVLRNRAGSQYGYLGVDEEICSERYHYSEISGGFNVEVDVAVGLPFIFPITVGAVPSVGYTKEMISTFVTNKTISYPAILKQIKETKDDIIKYSNNVAFCSSTGSPIVVKTQDEFNKNKNKNYPINNDYYSYTQFACETYPDMNQLALNDRREFLISGSISNIGNSSILVPTASTYDYAFSEGDLIRANDYNSNNSKLLYISKKNITASGHLNYEVEPFDASNIISNTFNFNTIMVENSGRANNLNAICGNVMTLGAVNIDYPTNLSLGSYVQLNPWVPKLNNIIQGGSFDFQYYSYDFNLPSPHIKAYPKLLGNYTPCYNGLLTLKTWVIGSNLYLGVVDYNNITNLCSLLGYIPPVIPSTLQLIDPTITINTSSTSLSPCICNTAFTSTPSKGLLLSFINLGTINGKFNIIKNPSKSIIVYNSPSGQQTTIDFVRIDTWDGVNFSNVLSNSNTTYSNHWDYSNINKYKIFAKGLTTLGYSGALNSIITNQIGKWRPDASYTFKGNRLSGNVITSGQGGKNFNSGTYILPFYTWSYPPLDYGWINTSNILTYTPHGEAIQDQNALYINTTSQYSQDNTRPKLLAANADYYSVYFESFEEKQTATVQYNFPNDNKHSGNSCLKINAGLSNKYTIDNLKLTPQIIDKGCVLKFWATNHPENSTTNILPYIEEIDAIINLPVTNSNLANSLTLKAKRISTCAYWSLYEVVIDLKSITILNNLYEYYNKSFTIDLSNNLTINNNGIISTNVKTTDIFIDDVRLQPLNTEMKTFVYDDNTRRLLTEFDDRHFGLYYIYTPEGKLMRKLKETEKGMKIIEEKQYNASNLQVRPK